MTEMPPPVYRLLIFDWDGTLLDSIASIVRCTQATLAELELPAASEDSIRSAIGLGIRETVESFCPGCDERTFGRIVEVYRRLWFGHYSREPVLFEGVPGLLERVGADGHLLAVATAKSRKGLVNDLERTGLAGTFHASRTVDEAPSKPSPQMLFAILDELGVEPFDALMIGDATHDVEMARNAGVPAIGVSTGTARREALLERGALGCLDGAVLLTDWLEKRSRALTNRVGATRIEG